MKKTELGKHKLLIYDSIEELPIKRFHKFNKMLLVDSGVGGDIMSVDKHLERIRAYIAGDKKDLAMGEIDNLRINMFFVLEHLSPRNLAFASLVAELDGEVCDDLSDDGLRKIVTALQDVPVKDLTQAFNEVKKKIDDDLDMYYPQMQDDSEVKEYFNILRKRTLKVLDSIIDGNDEAQDEIDNLTIELILYNKPQLFSGADSVEVQYDKQFERMCHIISSQLHTNPKEYTVTEYYAAFDYIKEQIKSQQKHFK